MMENSDPHDLINIHDSISWPSGPVAQWPSSVAQIFGNNDTNSESEKF